MGNHGYTARQWRCAERANSAATLEQVLAEQARSNPHADAVVSAEQRLSYAELAYRAAALGQRLRELGVGPERTVAVAVEPSVEWLVAVFGVFCAGGAFVPLDPRLPRSRLDEIAADAGAAASIESGGAAEALHGLRVSARRDGRVPRDVSSGQPGRRLAYVVYTSGSSGAPNGVAVEHRNLLEYCRAFLARTGLPQGAAFASLSTLAGDLAYSCVFPPLLCGGSVHFIPHPMAVDGTAVADYLERRRIDCLKIVPRHFLSLAATVAPQDLVPRRCLVFGGESPATSWVGEIARARPGVEIFNHYGPTETTIGATMYRFDRADPPAGATLPIGQPLAGAEVRLLGANGRPVDAGAVGEIVIGGSGVARGYLGRPELTRSRFVEREHGREFRSGDLARRLPGGDLVFAGRRDDQVKVRGYRVEPGEVQARIDAHPDVRQSLVAACADAAAGNVLAAYVEPDHSGDGWNRRRAEARREQVARWQTVHDATYEACDPAADAALNTVGWNSSYTGMPIPVDEMREWVGETVSRILELRPRRVLEIGCGSGMLLYRVAGRTEEYVGTDLSAAGVRWLQERVTRHPPDGAGRVEIVHGDAVDLSAVRGRRFDVIVLNSVAQHFPDADYLVTVLEGTAEHLAEGGRLFIGDARPLHLLELFHRSVQLYRAPADMRVAELGERAAQAVRREHELVVHPDFFTALRGRIPRIGSVDVLLKRGRLPNEMTRFRYDVVLHFDRVRVDGGRSVVLDWPEHGLSRMQIVEQLARERPGCMRLCNIPNARIAADVEAARLLDDAGYANRRVADIRAAAASTRPAGVADPDELCEIGRAAGYSASARWCGDGGDGRFEVVFRDPAAQRWVALDRAGQAATPAGAGDLAALCTDPLRPVADAILARDLRAHLAACLPDYMVPSRWQVLKRMPLLPNGKIDRGRLRASPLAAVVRDADSDEALSPDETVIAAVWGELLGVDEIAREQDFFELGGHSLLVAQLIVRLEQAVGVRLDYQDVFDNPTVAALAGRIAACRTADPRPLAGAVPAPAAHPDLAPLSFAQERLLAMFELVGGGAAHNVTYTIRLDGELDVAALEYALDRIVERHAVLRTAFPRVGDERRQRVLAHRRVRLPIVDLGAQGGSVEAEAARRNAMPFDLDRGPLVRLALGRLGARRHALWLTVHHAVFDGWSRAVFLTELKRLYEDRIAQRSERLVALPVQYADLALRERAAFNAERQQTEARWWRQTLRGVEPLRLPPLPPAAARAARGAREHVELGGALAAAVERLARRERASVFMVLAAAYGAALHALTGQHDLTIGTDVANRKDVDEERLIGFFINQLVLRIDVAGDPTFESLLRRVRTAALAAYSHQDLPFDRLVHALNPRRRAGTAPLFQAKLVLQNTPAPPRRMGGVLLSVAAEIDTVDFDLILDLTHGRERLDGWLKFDPARVEAGTASWLAARVEGVLNRAAQQPGLRVSELVGDAPSERSSRRSDAGRRFRRTGRAALAGAARRRRVLPGGGA